MNISGILGKDVELESLNDHALARGLDSIYKADPNDMMKRMMEEVIS